MNGISNIIFGKLDTSFGTSGGGGERRGGGLAGIRCQYVLYVMSRTLNIVYSM